MTTLRDVLPRDTGQHVAVSVPEGGAVLRFVELQQQVESCAAALQRGGVGQGDPVALVLPNGIEFLVTFLAVTRLGAVAAPLNPAFTAQECRFYMEESGTRAVVSSAARDTAGRAAETLDLPVWEASMGRGGRVHLSCRGGRPRGNRLAREPRPDDVALFLHTSGTTSRPKGVPLTHRNLMASIATIRDTYRLSPDDVSLLVMPLFHVHGLLGVALSTLYSGGTLIVPPRFSASRFWRQVGELRVSWYSAVPTIHQAVLAVSGQGDGPQGRLRFVRSCSAALPPPLMRDLEACCGAPVLQAYGMTEAAHQMASNPLPPAVRKPGTVGRATGVEIAILDDRGQALRAPCIGEVAVRGPSVIRGYHNNPQADAAAFAGEWFRTGDQGWVDADGYLTLTGRLKELINRGGEKISPLEVDAVLLSHPGVREAVCFGVPDVKYGEEVHAAVVLKADATARQVLDFCRARLAEFKVPKRLHVVEALPRTATGKIQRRQVAAQCA